LLEYTSRFALIRLSPLLGTGIGAEDGAKAYMSGVVPTMVRAMVVNMLQVGGYDVAKTNIKDFTGMDGVGLHVSSALTAGFVYSLATLPIDLAKTRMQVGLLSLWQLTTAAPVRSCLFCPMGCCVCTNALRVQASPVSQGLSVSCVFVRALFPL